MIKISYFIPLFLVLISCSDKKVIIEYYSNGVIKTKYTTFNDSINGDYITFYESGEIKSCVPFKNNVEQGIYKEFYKNGQVKKIFNLENKLREGIYLCYDSIGNVIECNQVDTTQIYEKVEVMPEFPGGITALMYFLQRNILRRS